MVGRLVGIGNTYLGTYTNSSFILLHCIAFHFISFNLYPTERKKEKKKKRMKNE